MKSIIFTLASVLAITSTAAHAAEPAGASAPTLAAPAPTCTPAPTQCAAPAPKPRPKRIAPAPVAVPDIPVRERVEPNKVDATTKGTLQAGSRWLGVDNRPTVGEDGRVVFTYGNGMPVVICAPLRICAIELQAGEKVIKTPDIGDSVRWVVSPSEFGSGKTAQQQVIVKPKEPGLDTNLMIATDKRSYYVRLLSSNTDYVARVAFAYPDEAQAAWEAFAAKRAELQKSEIADMPAMSIEKLRFDYSVEGEAAFKPIRVVDNGEKTYIQLPHSSKADEIPVLVVLSSDGKEQLVNSRFINGWFEVDRLFERAALIFGVGREQRKVVITNTARYRAPSVWNFGG